MISTQILTHQLEGAIAAYEVNQLAKGVLISGLSYQEIAKQLHRDGARLIADGAITLQLGVALYDRPFLFVPHSIIDEQGRTFRGEVVFDWIRTSAYDMPRSEVFGVNARGKPDQVFAREVDVEISPIVVGGPDTAPVYVALRIGTAQLPPRFAAALKVAAASDMAQVRRLVESA